MEFLRIEQSDKSRWNKVWELYESSFPIAERRKMKDHVRACSDPQFHPVSAWEDGEPANLLAAGEDAYNWLAWLQARSKAVGMSTEDWDRLDRCMYALRSFLRPNA